jgi:hypothetical protein
MDQRLVQPLRLLERWQKWNQREVVGKWNLSTYCDERSFGVAGNFFWAEKKGSSERDEEGSF